MILDSERASKIYDCLIGKKIIEARDKDKGQRGVQLACCFIYRLALNSLVQPFPPLCPALARVGSGPTDKCLETVCHGGPLKLKRMLVLKSPFKHLIETVMSI